MIVHFIILEKAADHSALMSAWRALPQTFLGMLQSARNHFRELLNSSKFRDCFTGTEYTLARIPMASTDFSTHEYSYCDKPDDFNLETFALAPEDYEYKVGLFVLPSKFEHKVI